MREIKFRAWVNDAMCYDIAEIEYQYFCLVVNDHPSEERAFLLDESILMQYTGLKDKNGKEIYEGDVLKITDYPFKECSQEKDKSNPFYKTEKVIYDPPCFNLNGWLEFDYDGEYEVIGNIHENPELLK